MKRIMVLSFVLMMTLAQFALAADFEIVTVVKITGIPWFNRMEEGIVKAGKDLGVKSTQIGPADADPAQQVKMIEDLVAKGVDAICVVPNDAKALEPVFKKAKEKGIIVLTHESPDQQGADWDIETIDNTKFGENHFEKLAELMGGEGEFAVFVGSLTVPLHNLWADIGLKYAAAKYPKMKLVTDRIPCGESVELSHTKTLELLKAYPNLKGIVGFGSLGPIGAAQALKEKKLCGTVKVVGTVLPAHAANYLQEGCMQYGYLWDPADAGYAMVAVAKLMLEKQEIKNGMEIPGLGAANVDAQAKIIKVDAILDITPENANKIGF